MAVRPHGDPLTSIWIPSAAHWILDECGLAGCSAQQPRIPVDLKKLEYNSLLLDRLHLPVRGVDTWVPIRYGIGNAIVHVLTF
jgi:hypothetical protein